MLPKRLCVASFPFPVPAPAPVPVPVPVPVVITSAKVDYRSLSREGIPRPLPLAPPAVTATTAASGAVLATVGVPGTGVERALDAKLADQPPVTGEKVLPALAEAADFLEKPGAGQAEAALGGGEVFICGRG